MPAITCIDDLRVLHRRRTPRMFYDYCDSGSWTEATYRDNSAALQALLFRQRVAVNMSDRRLERKIVGQDAVMPVALAPVGLTGMQSADGEIKAARAAADFGVPFTLSTMSICSIEDVARHSPSPFWFQVYAMRDQGFLKALVQRAIDAKCSALVVTLDLQVLGQRHKDIRNGLAAPPKPTMLNLLDIARRPRWVFGRASTPRRSFGNIVGHVSGVKDVSSLSSWVADQFDPDLNWQKIAAIRAAWPGKLILKGIVAAEDAHQAVAVGADAIVVSNHGGRQLDGAPAAIRSLASIVDAVGDKTEVMFDSGIRTGQDILRALALGARSVMVGRAYIHGLGAMGQTGVTRALEILRKEMDITLALCGLRDIEDVSPAILHIPPDFALPA